MNCYSLPTLIPERNSKWQINSKSNTTWIEYELLFITLIVCMLSNTTRNTNSLFHMILLWMVLPANWFPKHWFPTQQQTSFLINGLVCKPAWIVFQQIFANFDSREELSISLFLINVHATLPNWFPTQQQTLLLTNGLVCLFETSTNCFEQQKLLPE